MSGEPGIKAQKHRSVWRKDIKVNPKSLVVALGKAAINGAFLKWDDLAESGVEVLSSLGLEKKAGEVAGLLIIRSLLHAMQNLLKENRELLIKKPDNPQELYKELNSSLASGELVIDQEFFQHPKNLPIVAEAQTGFARWLENFVEKKVEAENISRRLPSYFVFALNEEWVSRSSDYAELKEVLDTPFTQASRREQGWLRYRAWLQKRIEEPIFWETFSLKQVYLPLRAYYEQKVEGDTEQKLELGVADRKHKRVVVDLNRELETWLQEANSNDAIRLISGGPGSGKSSFCKMFAAQQAEKGEIPVLFIPLHLFKFSNELVKDVESFVQLEDLLHHNPLDRENGESRLLIIFDGLDELSMQGKVAQETAKQFIEEVRFLVERFKSRSICLQVLISGREVVVQANWGKFRKPHQLLYLLPYFVTEEEREDENYVDEQNLLEEDQRQLWWQSYGKLKGKDYQGLPSELDKQDLVDITAQPLLNYLVAFSIERGKLQFTAETNLNEIYGDLLEAIYERGYEGTNRQHRAIEEITKEEFIAILEEIALACWHGLGRTTTVQQIEYHCKNSGLIYILERFQNSFKEDSNSSIIRLLTAFYFRKSGDLRGSEDTFEFTHKSFGEYLTAKRIVEEVKLIHEDLEERKKNFRKGCDEQGALVKWATLCNSGMMDQDLFKFICDEMRLQNLEDVCNWQTTLCHLIESMLRNGMPMESLEPRPKFYLEMWQARNAEETLLAVLNACARVTEEISQIQWPDCTSFGTWISRLQGQRISIENVLAFECLSFLNLQGCILSVRDFVCANFALTNLEDTRLNFANLIGANLEGANLQGANLFKANLGEASLRGANLQEANLQEANLQAASLQEANFQEANLQGANLIAANLEGVNLEGTNLKGTILFAANLEGANLEGVNLEGANLEEANLKGTILEGMDITKLTTSSDKDSEES